MNFKKKTNLPIRPRTNYNPETKLHEIIPFATDFSFDKGFFVTVKSIQALRRKNPDQTIVVGIAGPSGSGKSSLAGKIVDVLPNTIVISLDNYLDTSRKVIDQNFDDYRLLDFGLAVSNIQDLKSGNSTKLPLYDFRKSGRYAYKVTKPPSNKIIILEGTYALHPKVKSVIDLSISVSGGVHFDLIKRIFRDVRRTGQSPEEALTQITATVYPMYKAFIEPDLENAVIRIRNDFNPIQGLLNPTYILKTRDTITESAITAAFNIIPTENGQISSTESYYDIYLHHPQKKSSLSSDWIRVRNHNGRYSLMFSDQIRDSGFLISPRFNFVVTVKVLGGLMSLGYQIGAMMHRTSTNYNIDVRDNNVVVSLDYIHQLRQTFVQVKGQDREAVASVGKKLKLKNFIPHSYIEIMAQKNALNNLKPSPIPAMIPPHISEEETMEILEFTALDKATDSSNTSTITSNQPEELAPEPIRLKVPLL